MSFSTPSKQDQEALLDACIEEGMLAGESIKQLRNETGYDLREAADVVLLYGKKNKTKMNDRQLESYASLCVTQRISWER